MNAIAVNGMLASIRFSDTFCLVVPKHIFIRPICSRFIGLLKTPYEVILKAQGFNVGSYGICPHANFLLSNGFVIPNLYAGQSLKVFL